MKTTAKLSLLTLLLVAPAARAAEAPAAAPPAATVGAPPPATRSQAPDVEAPPAIAAEAPEARGTADDPNIDRAFLLPTAMTQPAGSATYNNYELLLHGLTYGVTDRVQLTVTVLAPIVEDIPFVGLLAAKWQFLSTPRFHMAVQGSAGLAQELKGGSSNVTTVGVGAFATACLTDDCGSLLSASASYQLAVPSVGSDSAQFVIYGGSLVAAVSPHVKLLAELASATGRDSSSSFDNVPGAIVSYGLRLHGASFASDIGFIKPIVNGSDDGILLGLPFASVSYRWL